MGYEPGHQHQIRRSRAENLVGDMHLSAARVLSGRPHLGQPNSADAMDGGRGFRSGPAAAHRPVTIQPAETPAVALAPAARACTSWVVSAFPPIAQSPLCTSSSTHQVTPRMFSPSIDTIASVSFCTISRRCELEKTPSITLILISGISHAPFPSCSCAAPVRGLLSSTGLVPFTLGTLLSRYIRTTTDSNKLKYRPSRLQGRRGRGLSRRDSGAAANQDHDQGN